MVGGGPRRAPAQAAAALKAACQEAVVNARVRPPPHPPADRPTRPFSPFPCPAAPVRCPPPSQRRHNATGQRVREVLTVDRGGGGGGGGGLQECAEAAEDGRRVLGKSRKFASAKEAKEAKIAAAKAKREAKAAAAKQ